ncbi:hypothetical protein [Bacillus solitudinis]|uniref:hypothetical protein n=1 Tax=Bacillus solitudinis TaxID=2014074 RepID=UPI000C234452|nr:hypothetical protein [Bacillus solitudinis]
MSKKTVLLILYGFSLLFFIRSLIKIVLLEGTGGYGMFILSALVMTFILITYLKERRKSKEQ